MTTITIPAVEMSREEENRLWGMSEPERKVWFNIRHWITDDGNNCIKFDGEDFYREVVRKGN